MHFRMSGCDVTEYASVKGTSLVLGLARSEKRDLTSLSHDQKKLLWPYTSLHNTCNFLLNVIESKTVSCVSTLNSFFLFQANSTPSLYAEGYIVFVFPFVCSFVHLFAISSRSWNCFQVLRLSNLSGVYLTNLSSESIHIWTIGTLEGWLSFHDFAPKGPCPGVGLEVKI